jgi:hypothetical protein
VTRGLDARGMLVLAVLALSACGGDATEPAPAGPSYSQVVKSDHPIAYWRFEEATGTVAGDSSGMNRPGAYDAQTVRGTTLSSALGYGLTMTSGGVTVPHADWMSLSTMTVEMWVRPNRVTYVNAILMLAMGDAWQLQVTKDGYPAFTYPGGTRGARAATPFVVGQLYHVAATFTPGFLRLYINGEFAGEAPTDDPLPTDPHDLYIGRGQGGALYFVGMVDEVALYDHALDTTRIRAHYEAGR